MAKCTPEFRPWLWPLLAAAAITAFCAYQRIVLMHSSMSGPGQTAVMAANLVGSLLSAFPRYIAYYFFPPLYHHDTSGTRVAMLITTFLFYATTSFVLFWFGRKSTPPLLSDQSLLQDQSSVPATASTATESGSLVSRRVFLSTSARRTAMVVGATAGGSAGAYAMFVEPRYLPVTHRRFPMKDLPAEMSGIRVVQLTDIHHGPWINLDFVKRMVSVTNALQPDLIVLTGDYITANARFITPVLEVLASLRAKIGVVGVLGNHDWWEDISKMRDQFARRELPLIDNRNLFLSPEKRLLESAPRHGLCIAGVGDYWEDEVDVAAALRGAPDDMPRLLLSHNPDVAEMPIVASGEHRIDLMLSGHTHGGQIRIPFAGTPGIPSRFGQKYAQGLVQGPGCPVYISRGIGMTVLPLRLGVPPEIAVIELVRA